MPPQYFFWLIFWPVSSQLACLFSQINLTTPFFPTCVDEERSSFDVVVRSTLVELCTAPTQADPLVVAESCVAKELQEPTCMNLPMSVVTLGVALSAILVDIGSATNVITDTIDTRCARERIVRTRFAVAVAKAPGTDSNVPAGVRYSPTRISTTSQKSKHHLSQTFNSPTAVLGVI